MSLCTVESLRSVLGVGALHTDATLQDACDAADEILLPMLARNAVYNYAHSNADNVGTLYFSYSIQGRFYVGQSVTVSGNGSKHNGHKTLTEVSDYRISYALADHPADAPIHAVMPSGMVLGDTYTDYTSDTSIIQAATMIAVDVWQARNSAGVGSIGPDGQPMPYRLGASLLGRVRALIAHAVSPGSLAM